MTVSAGLSFLGIEPGHRSKDGVVVVGYEGFLFIAGGTNNVIDQYGSGDRALIERKAKGWLALMERRHEGLMRRDIRYVQVIVPEKSSLVPEYFPSGDVMCETPLLASIENGLSTETCASYAGALSAMRAMPRRRSLVRRLDSHLTPTGAHCIFDRILTTAGEQATPPISFPNTVLLGSDLGAKLCDLPFKEEVAFPAAALFAGHEEGLQCATLEAPSDHQHIGIKAIWRNPSSVLDLRVVAFANSFFERGMSPCNLTWWAARWFREFHFVWSPKLDYDYIDVVRPDVCICQTVERFLPMLPAS